MFIKIIPVISFFNSIIGSTESVNVPEILKQPVLIIGDGKIKSLDKTLIIPVGEKRIEFSINLKNNKIYRKYFENINLKDLDFHLISYDCTLEENVYCLTDEKKENLFKFLKKNYFVLKNPENKYEIIISYLSNKKAKKGDLFKFISSEKYKNKAWKLFIILKDGKNEPFELQTADFKLSNENTDIEILENIESETPPDPTKQLETPPDPTQQLETPPDPTQQLETPPDPTKQLETPPDPTKQLETPPDPTKQLETPPDPTQQLETPPDPTKQLETPPDPTKQLETPPDPTQQLETPPDPTQQLETPPDPTKQQDILESTSTKPLDDSITKKGDQPIYKDWRFITVVILLVVSLILLILWFLLSSNKNTEND